MSTGRKADSASGSLYRAKGKGKKLEINIDSDDNLSDQDLDNDDLQPLDKKQLEFWKRKPT